MRTTIAMLSLLVLTGCASLDRIGRSGSGIAGLVAPEHKGAVDNILDILQRDQLFADGVEFVARTPDGKTWGLQEILVVPVVRQPDGVPLPEMPAGWLRRIAKQPLPPEVEDQRQLLIDALKQLPTKEE